MGLKPYSPLDKRCAGQQLRCQDCGKYYPDRCTCNKPDKGEKDGSCNRTACQQPHAKYYNHSTQKYYCATCAADLNDYNRTEAMRLYGHDLCTLDLEPTTDGQKLVEFCNQMMGCK